VRWPIAIPRVGHRLSWACTPLQSAPLRVPYGRTPCIRCDSAARTNDCLPRGLFPFSVSPRGAAVSSVGRSKARPPAPSGFLDRLTLSSAPCLLALFRARSAHGVHPFRALLHPCSRAPSSGVVALSSLVLPRHRARTCVTGAPRERPRPQGFAPHEHPPLRDGGLDHRERVALLGFCESLIPARVASCARSHPGKARREPAR
jgi:hypothetical protein